MVISTQSENVRSPSAPALRLAGFVGVGLGRGLDEEEGLLVGDALLQLELNQRKNLEGDERVDERLCKNVSEKSHQNIL